MCKSLFRFQHLGETADTCLTLKNCNTVEAFFENKLKAAFPFMDFSGKCNKFSRLMTLFFLGGLFAPIPQKLFVVESTRYGYDNSKLNKVDTSPQCPFLNA